MPNAIVFGASSGIGKQLALMLVKDGFRVAITGRRLVMLEDIKSSNLDNFIIKENNVQKIDQTERVFNDLVNELGTVDLIIHSSGVGYENPELDWQKEYDTIQTNVLGATIIYDLAFKLFQKQKSGHLVAVIGNLQHILLQRLIRLIIWSLYILRLKK